MSEMEQTSLRLPVEMLDELDELVDQGHYTDRSDAIRSAIRIAYMGEP